jgi:alkanesulfonate monooxygenase SsuD/methylene tetrahydromethanopterin reductase-like flavin-dependent oxidoreductase (luciferase family)
MLRLAGEIADGVVLWLCNPEYIRNTVVPMVAEGRAKAGKPAEGFDIVAAVPSAVTSDPDQATAQLRSELIPYFSLPFYRKMIELSGFEDDLAGFDERERAILAYARQLTVAPAAITESDLDAMRGVGLDDGEILEANQVVAYFAYANRTVLGLGVTTHGDVLGFSPPDSASDDWRHA